MNDRPDRPDPIVEIRRMVQGAPFRPFSVLTTGGKVLMVNSPESASISSDEREVVIAERNTIHRLRAARIVGVYPEEDVSAVALIQAEGRGRIRGLNVGLVVGLVFGFFLGWMTFYFLWINRSVAP